MRRCTFLFALIFIFTLGVLAQTPPPTPDQNAPSLTLHVSTRMVTVEVVAREHGKPATGLTAADFEVFDQSSGFHKEKKPQKIAAFRALGITEFASKNNDSVQVPAGVYTNLVTLQKDPVPPTIILVDGLNTDNAGQIQIRDQMVRMLGSLPEDVPVAIFLLGRRLRMLQSFTTDPKLLKTALQKATTIEANGLRQIDPRDDPNSLSSFQDRTRGIVFELQEESAGARSDMLRRFEQETYAFTLDIRVSETIDALRSIALHVAGYPGRKNLLWLSSSFPIAINPQIESFNASRDYGSQMEELANTLGEAKIAVYPITPAGSDTAVDITSNISQPGSAGRRSQNQMNSQATMEILAGDTGGQICTDNNDLSYCVKKAVSDSSSFYEIGYYPDSSDWHGEFHKIIVKTKQSGVHLAYRQGYFARPEGGDSSDAKTLAAKIQQAACEDLLTATSVTLAVRTLPPDSPEKIKYWVLVDPETITFPQASETERGLDLMVAACTFNKAGKPLQLFRDPIERKLNDHEYKTLLAEHFVPHNMVFAPGPDAAMVRVMVRDNSSGRIGSVNIPYPAAPAVAAAANAQPSSK
ncbi:MAG TPA: VWA domain-containing protein [Terriglobales bacterium]